MNFLAHCLLADQASNNASTTHASTQPSALNGLLAGAVIGDFVKGPISEEWPIPLQHGVQLHRKVDALSNRNIHTKLACDHFPPSLRRYAPIYLDLLADYHLSHRWSQLHSEPIEEFAQRSYAAINSFQAYLSPQGRRFYEYLVEQSLLTNYHQWIHIERAIHSIMRRLKKTDLTDEAVATCADLRIPTEAHCISLIQDLQRQVETWQP